MVRRMPYKLITFLCITMLLIGFGLGYYSYIWTSTKYKNYNLNSTENQEDMQNSNQFVENSENPSVNADMLEGHQQETSVLPVDVDTQDQQISINTKVIFERNYLKCGHTSVEEGAAPAEMINLTEQEVVELYPEWEVVEFDNTRVVLSSQVNDKCLNHYVVKEYEGKIGIYYQNSDVANPLKQVLDINIRQLREEDRENLRKGIYVESDKELAQLIEDFGS